MKLAANSLRDGVADDSELMGILLESQGGSALLLDQNEGAGCYGVAPPS